MCGNLTAKTKKSLKNMVYTTEYVSTAFIWTNKIVKQITKNRVKIFLALFLVLKKTTSEYI